MIANNLANQAQNHCHLTKLNLTVEKKVKVA